jgi:DNA-binding NtrC family response regulator
MNGVETLAALRELRPELPVLVASGHISPAAAAAISRYARVGCLAKPFLLDEIRQAVATFFP